MSLPWFRMYHEFAGDPVMQGLAFEDQRHYVMVLCFKASGLLDREMPSVDIRHAVICKALGLDVLAGSEARRRLSAFGLVDEDWQPSAWDRRQFKSDVSTGRVQKYRERSSSESSEEELIPLKTDTERNVSSNVSETFHKPKAKRATGIPEDFGLTDERTKYAADRLPNVDAPELLASFRDHHSSKGTVAKDWDASWRTWVRNAQKFGYPMVRLTAAQVATAKPKRIDPNGRVLCG
jgi:hypothetical protein